MRNFKGKVNIALRVGVFALVLVMCFQLCNVLIATENTYTRVMLHEMYTAPKEPEMVFLGGSTTYRHFDPEIWDKTTGLYTFNLGSSNQTAESSYYLLKEVFSQHDPKYCIYGLTSALFLQLEAWENPQKDYILFDYFKPSLNKFNYILSVLDGNSAYAGMLPFLRNKTSLSPALVRQNLEKKQSENYRNYGYDIYSTDYESYKGRGFVFSNRQTEAGAVGELTSYPFPQLPKDEEILTYFQKIMELCRQNDCELILVAPPVPRAHLALQGDYQQVCDFYQQLAQENGLTLFDFSMVRPEVLPLDDTAFYDWVHMSGEGATAFSSVASEVVAKYLAGEEIDTERIFYATYQELLEDSPYVFNAWLSQEDGEYTANCTYGANVTPEYQLFWRSGEEAEWELLQEYGQNRSVSAAEIPERASQLLLYVRPVGSEALYQQSHILNIS